MQDAHVSRSLSQALKRPKSVVKNLQADQKEERNTAISMDRSVTLSFQTMLSVTLSHVLENLRKTLVFRGGTLLRVPDNTDIALINRA